MARGHKIIGQVKPHTIDNALYHLRALCVRDGHDGLNHVEALLRIRGLDPDAMHVPKKQPRRFRRGELRSAVLGALKGGPVASRAVTEAIRLARPDLDESWLHPRIMVSLSTLKNEGLVKREAGGWSLA